MVGPLEFEPRTDGRLVRWPDPRRRLDQVHQFLVSGRSLNDIVTPHLRRRSGALRNLGAVASGEHPNFYSRVTPSEARLQDQDAVRGYGPKRLHRVLNPSRPPGTTTPDPDLPPQASALRPRRPISGPNRC